jgi:DNA-directed RNA polymerase specialized sigma subunit
MKFSKRERLKYRRLQQSLLEDDSQEWQEMTSLANELEGALLNHLPAILNAPIVYSHLKGDLASKGIDVLKANDLADLHGFDPDGNITFRGYALRGMFDGMVERLVQRQVIATPNDQIVREAGDDLCKAVERNRVIAEQRLIQQRLLEKHPQTWNEMLQLAECIARSVCPNHLRSQHEEDCAEEGIRILLERDYVRKFEPERGILFSTYASALMKWAMFDYLDEQRLIKLPRLFRKIFQTHSELWKELGYEPSASETAEALGTTPQKVDEALRWRDEYFGYFIRIDQPSDPTDDDSMPVDPPDPSLTPEEEMVAREEAEEAERHRRPQRKQVERLPIAVRMLDNPNHAVVWILSVFGNASDLEIEQALLKNLDEDSDLANLRDDKASYEEIAQAVDSSSGTVGKWKTRARLKLVEITEVLSRVDDKSVDDIHCETEISQRKVENWREGYQVLRHYSSESSIEQICEITELPRQVVDKWIANADKVNALIERARKTMQP